MKKQCPGINLTKNVQDLHWENYRDIKEEINKCRYNTAKDLKIQCYKEV